MRLEHFFYDLAIEDFLETLLPDFILAFTFFTGLIFAILGKRFGKDRPAIAMSAALGLALSIGLVWWERRTGFSIRDLGPIAIGFTIILLAFVLYQAIKQVGGSWAGAGIALGASILVAQFLELNVPIRPGIIQTIAMFALIIGILALVSHTRSNTIAFPHIRNRLPNVRHDMSDLYRNRHLSGQLNRTLKKLRKRTDNINESPKDTGSIILQLNRMLPAEGYLTERMAQLRAKAHRIKNGHIAKLEETRHVFAKSNTAQKKKASAKLMAQYKQMTGMDTRIERLDTSVAENEKRIRELTRQAQIYAAKYDHRGLHDTIKAAEKLQHHNTKLLKIIARTEARLSAAAKKFANEVTKIDN